MRRETRQLLDFLSLAGVGFGLYSALASFKHAEQALIEREKLHAELAEIRRLVGKS